MNILLKSIKYFPIILTICSFLGMFYLYQAKEIAQSKQKQLSLENAYLIQQKLNQETVIQELLAQYQRAQIAQRKLLEEQNQLERLHSEREAQFAKWKQEDSAFKLWAKKELPTQIQLQNRPVIMGIEAYQKWLKEDLSKDKKTD